MRFAFSNVRYLTFCVIMLGLHVDAEEPAEKRGSQSQQIKVAAVQIDGYDKGDLPREGFHPEQKMVPYIDRAGDNEAELVVFPEYVLGHISVPGPETKAISQAAARNQIYVIIGCWEEFTDGTYANTALVFDRQGKIAGKYRKTHAAVDKWEGSPPWAHPPQGKELSWFRENDPEWTMEKGMELPVFDFDFGKVGIMTCYDGWFPEPARVLSIKGAELIVWINGRGGSIEDFIVKSIMFQSHVAMITANQAYGSGTMIGDGSNRRQMIQSHCPDKGEKYITGTINLERIRFIRSHSRNFQQRRPDLYHDLTIPTKELDVANP